MQSDPELFLILGSSVSHARADCTSGCKPNCSELIQLQHAFLRPTRNEPFFFLNISLLKDMYRYSNPRSGYVKAVYLLPLLSYIGPFS